MRMSSSVALPPWAARGALLPRLELAGLACVLENIASDGQRRAMHLCESSIVQSGAVQALTAVLDDHSLTGLLRPGMSAIPTVNTKATVLAERDEKRRLASAMRANGG